MVGQNKIPTDKCVSVETESLGWQGPKEFGRGHRNFNPSAVATSPNGSTLQGLCAQIEIVIPLGQELAESCAKLMAICT